MNDDLRTLIARIHASPSKLVVAVTGGGASAVAWLLAVPGASRTVLEAVVPYAQASLESWLGGAPESYCSAATARQMARRGRDRAAWLAPGERAVGVACTASLRSDRPKKGDHRAHVAFATGEEVVSWSLTLAKDQRERDGEDSLCGQLILNAVAEAFGLAERLTLPLLPGEAVVRESESTGLLADLLAGRVEAVCVEPDGRMHTDKRERAVLLPGSFNPLHHGHAGMAEAAARRTGQAVTFELSVCNPDKGVISGAEARRRLGQFCARSAVWLTRAATFDHKARLFPGATFVVGADTAVRVVQTRFYADSVEKMREALNVIRTAGCRFLVAGRADAEGMFVGLQELAIPAEFADLFDGLSADEFRADVSSTGLRAGAADRYNPPRKAGPSER
jgi:nicotinamide mononucleotide (NMN) deamidase PncC